MVKLDEKQAARKLEHWARNRDVLPCEQCGRNRVPEVTLPASPTTTCSAGSIRTSRAFF